MDNARIADALTAIRALSPRARRKVWDDPATFPLFYAYYYCDHIRYPFADFHFDFFSDLESLLRGETREVAWIAFRESGKTSIARAFLAYLAATEKRRYIVVSSFVKENAEDTLMEVANALGANRRMVQDFGVLFSATHQKKDDEPKTIRRLSRFICNNGVLLEAVSTQESLRGRVYRGQRPDFILFDDFETAKTVLSQKDTLRIRAHMLEAVTALDASGGILYLGNYISTAGNVHMLLERGKAGDGTITTRLVPIADERRRLAWPQKYSWEAEEGKVSVDDIRSRIPPSTFAAEFLCDPRARETYVFTPDKFRYRPRRELEHLRVRKVLAIDTAARDNPDESGDFCGVVFNTIDEANRWHLEAYRMRLSTKQLIDFIFHAWITRGLDAIGIEKTPYVEGLWSALQDEMQRRGVYPVVHLLSHRSRNKLERIRGELEPRYHTGQIVHLVDDDGNNLAEALEQELLAFPAMLNDDVADAAAYLSEISLPPDRDVEEMAGADEDVNFARRNI